MSNNKMCIKFLDTIEKKRISRSIKSLPVTPKMTFRQFSSLSTGV